MFKNWVKLNCSFKVKTDPWNTIKHSFRPYNTLPASNESEQHENLTLRNIILKRQEEATRSVVVQVASENSFDELYKYCGQFGRLTNHFHYSINSTKSNYILLEYENAESADAALHSAIFKTVNTDHESIPANSRFLWFCASSKENIPKSTDVNTNNNKISVVNGTSLKSNEIVTQLLLNASDLTDQIQTLYQETRLNDLGMRLRFLGALQIESLFHGIFSDIRVIPFGSSINGFGKMGSDLDLILRFNIANTRMDKRKRLVFHTNQTEYNKKELNSKYVEAIAPFIRLFAPGVENTNCISQARVPIIKYHHKHLDLNVDLSMSNMSGFYMSELLHVFGEIDPRVRPLLSFIRLWAKATGLTNSAAGVWLTNFSLTCLTLCFLQQVEKPVLPTLAKLVTSAREEDIHIDDEVNGTFLRDITKLDFKTENTDSLADLLYKFFVFYSKLELENLALSLHTTKNIENLQSVPLYIVNPLEKHLNVSRNVSYKEYFRFKKEVENVVWLFESGEIDKKQSDKHWGLVKLFTKENMKKSRVYY